MLNTTGIQNGLLSKNDVTTEEFHEADDWGSVYSYNLLSMICVCVVLGAIVLGTILGNIFVISAILLQKSLRATTWNYLILSLAVTDLMVAVFVLPISIENQVTIRWRLQTWVCDMWTSMDVMCCTASILHLLAITLNRYLSVTYVGYTRRLSTHKVVLMIAIVWCVSFCISIPRLLGWRDSKQSPEFTGYCVVSQDLGYVLFATLGAFCIPLIFIIILNLKIYQVAKERVKNDGTNGSRMPQPSQSDTACSDQTVNATSTSGI
ncbi:5-hydroxytryptamine receptor-like [Liolophura sinensis]|uniref:5-hydroxytryptamine receptor-like n=1 Tax=Liolophura sinensis TaxID=3198878 RepID=UPI0031584889